MRFDDLDLDSVLTEFAKIEKEQGMDKKATHSLMSNLFDDTGSSDLDISEDLKAMAAEERSKLYDVVSDDVWSDAHPGGNKKLEGVDAEGDLAVIEDLEGLKKRMLEIVQKEMKAKASRIAIEVVMLADKLDEAGFKVMADRLDRTAAVLVEADGPDIEMGEATVTNESEALVSNLKDGLNNFFLDVSPSLARLSDNDRDSVIKAAQEAMQGANALEVAEDNIASLNALTTVKNALEGMWYWTADIHQYFDPNNYELTMNYINRGLEVLSGQASEPEGVDEGGVGKTQPDHGSMMLKVQKKVNGLLENLGYDATYSVSENGNPGDKKTYKVVADVFGLVAGKDYKNWNQLLSALDAKSAEMKSNVQQTQEEAKEPSDPSGQGTPLAPNMESQIGR